MTKPFYKMTEEEARSFAFRQAIGAAETTRFRTHDGTRGMDEKEVREYAGALLSAISYFNKRDPRHAEEVRYCELCRKQNEERAVADKQRHAERTEVYIL